MNKKSVGLLGIAVVLGCSSLAVSCSSDPSPTELGSGGAGTSGGAGGSPGDDAGGRAESGEAGLNESGGFAQGGAEQNAAGSAGESGSTSGAGGDSDEGESDVVGTVVDGEGAVVASTMVEIAGQLVMTDNLGRFTVHHVPETYSAVIVFVPQPQFPLGIKTVEIYDELTTRTPHFRLVHVPLDEHTGTITGSLSGGAGFPMPDDQAHRFFATASNSNRSWEDANDIVTPDMYGLPVLNWSSQPANKFTVGGLQWRTGQDGMPIAYDGWVSQEVVLPTAPKYSEVTLDLVLAPVEARTVTGTITKPADCIPSVEGRVGGIILFNDVPTTPKYSYLMPKPLSGATTRLAASCRWGTHPNGTSSQVSVGLDAANSLDLAIPSPPRLMQPSHEATGVTYATPLSWAAGDHQLRVITFEVAGWTIYRYGTSTSSSFPDLTRFGISIPPSSPVSWVVWSFEFDAGASTTWDDNTGRVWDLVSTGHSIARADSQQWSFKLAP